MRVDSWWRQEHLGRHLLVGHALRNEARDLELLRSELLERRRLTPAGWSRRGTQCRAEGKPATGPNVAARAPYDEESSDREVAVLRLLRTELNQREIGEALFVSFNTVKTHVKSIYRKLDVVTRADAVARARELHLL